MAIDPSLRSVLATHRRFAAIGSVLWAVLLVAAGGTLVSALKGSPGLINWVGLTCVVVGLLLALSRLGYVDIRQKLIADAERREEILSSVNRDALTGAFNRAYFFAQFRQHVRHDAEHPVGYMQIDMDNLKVLNDGFGHGAGDAALVHLVKTIETLVPNAIIGRLGGDEFGIVVVGHDNKAALRRLGDHLLDRLGEPVMIAGRSQRLSATIGVAVAPLDGIDADQLVSKADLALYKGKKTGRRKTIAFEGEMLADERHKRFVERDLRAAILLNELDLHYQPVVASDGTVTSHESLVRWQHTVRGLVSPADFIHVAEESELIDQMGDWVLRRACHDRLALGDLPIAINVSPVQLRRPDFADRFQTILRETETAGSSVIAEITETVPLSAGPVETANIDALRQMGVRIAVDDFGAGHASLDYLRNFKFDILKLDRSLIVDIATNRVDAMLVSAVCRIARVIGVSVVAEGVETEEQRKTLLGLGCTHLQGYFLGRPAPLGLQALAARPAAA